MNTPPLRLVICGTDTDVGKTIVSALFVQGLEATYWKPVQSGTEGGGDRQRVIDLLELPRGALATRSLCISSSRFTALGC